VKRFKQNTQNGEQLQARQLKKLSKLQELRAEMNEIETRLTQKAAIVVQKLEENPPDPHFRHAATR